MHPDKALATLLEGNDRFINGIRSDGTMFNHQKLRELAELGQKPFAIVLTCSDSRSPVEMIFDQGIGELFVVRVAGNVVAPSLLASMEFAATNFGSSLILVMGHSKCGAVRATYEHVKNPLNALPSPHLEELVGRIRPAVESSFAKGTNVSEFEFIESCAIENVKRSVRLIVDQSTIIRELIQHQQLKIIGSMLDIKTGVVRVL